MSVKEFELFHGAVLTKLMRNHRPVALSMIETRPSEGFFYTINDEVECYIKHRTGHMGKKGAISWQFSFTPEEIRKFGDVKQKRGCIYVALVCSLPKKTDSNMQVAFFDPIKKTGIDSILDLNSKSSQTFTIKDNMSGKLVVIKNYVEIMKISKSALDKWDVPGR